MKICSLLPSGTEIAFALGLGDQVAGVSDLCDHPTEARTKHVACRSLIDTSVLTSREVEQKIREYTDAGESTYEIDTEWLDSTRPDLILTQDLCYVCDVDAGQVFKAVDGFNDQPRVLVLSPRTVPEIYDNIREVGEAAGVPDRAEALVSKMCGRVEAVTSKVGRSEHRPRVFSLEGVDPLVAGGHWIPEMRLLAGGRDDMFAPGCPAMRLEWQRVSSYDPDVLLLTLCSSDLSRSLGEVHWLARQQGWWDMEAVRTGQVYLIDHVRFSRPGPRIVQGIEMLAQIFHPGLFTGLIPRDTVMKLDLPAAGSCLPEEMASHFRPYP